MCHKVTSHTLTPSGLQNFSSTVPAGLGAGCVGGGGMGVGGLTGAGGWEDAGAATAGDGTTVAG